VKRNNQRYSIAFQEQRGTNRGVPKFSGSEDEQSEVFQSFSGAKGNKQGYSKVFQE